MVLQKRLATAGVPPSEGLATKAWRALGAAATGVFAVYRGALGVLPKVGVVPSIIASSSSLSSSAGKKAAGRVAAVVSARQARRLQHDRRGQQQHCIIQRAVLICRKGSGERAVGQHQRR